MESYIASTCGRVKERAATFDWSIPDGSGLQPGLYSSPKVNYFNIQWFIEVDKNRYNIDTLYLRRILPTPGIPEPVRFAIQWKTPDGGGEGSVLEQTFPRKTNWWGQHIDCPCRTPSGEVTFTCTLWKGDSHPARGVSRETRTDCATCSNSRRDEHVNPGFIAISSLSEHFQNLLLSEDGHDILIKVKEKRFRAHKHILKARSPVFAAMFDNEMTESAEGSVTIEDCNPDAFGDFLQFVYSGKVDIASVGSALGLYYTGDKYDFPRLKEMCLEFLKNSFTTTTVFEVVSLAERHDEEELRQQAIVYLSTHLKEVMRTVEWQCFLTVNPIQANAMCLKALECKKH